MTRRLIPTRNGARQKFWTTLLFPVPNYYCEESVGLRFLKRSQWAIWKSKIRKRRIRAPEGATAFFWSRASDPILCNHFRKIRVTPVTEIRTVATDFVRKPRSVIKATVLSTCVDFPQPSNPENVTSSMASGATKSGFGDELVFAL